MKSRPTARWDKSGETLGLKMPEAKKQ